MHDLILFLFSYLSVSLGFQWRRIVWEGGFVLPCGSFVSPGHTINLLIRVQFSMVHSCIHFIFLSYLCVFLSAMFLVFL